MALRAATPTVGTGASQTAGTPGGTVSAGEYLGLWVVTDDFSASPSPSGMTVRGDASISLPDGQTAKLFDKIATGSEGTGIAVTGLATGNTVMIMFALTGRNTTTPRTFTPHVASSTTNSPSVITISDTVTGTGAAGDDQVWMVMLDAHGIAGWAFGNSVAGWTRQVNQDDTWAPAGLYSRNNVAGGAIGTLSTTATNAGNNAGWGAIVISIAQAAAGGATAYVPQNNEPPRRSYSFPAKHLQQATGLAAMLRTPPVHEAFPALRGWQPPANRATTNEARPAVAVAQGAVGASTDSPLPERYPPPRASGVDPPATVLYASQVEATQPAPRPFALDRAFMLGAEAFPAPQYDPEVEAYPALFGWRPGPNRERGADVAPPLTATAPVPNADPALTGWRAPLNRATGAETPPPLLATQPVPNTDQPRRGWQPPPNREAGAIPVPPVVFAPPAEAKPAEFGWRRVGNRDRGADGLPAASSLPSFPDVPAVWEFTRQAPPLQLKDGVTPLAAVRATGPVGDVSPAWRPQPRAIPWLGGVDPVVTTAQAALAPAGFVSDAPRPPAAREFIGQPDPWPPLLADWAPPNDTGAPRASRLRSLEQTQTFAPLRLAPWGFEPTPTRQQAPRRPYGNDGAALGAVTVYHLLPWIWEPGPLWGARQRNRAADQATGNVLFGFAGAHGPIHAVTFARQLPVINVASFANQLLTVTISGFANQLASIQVVSFDENE